MAASSAVTTLSPDRRSLAAGTSAGAPLLYGGVRYGGLRSTLAGALILVLAPRPAHAGPGAEVEPGAAVEPADSASSPEQDERIERAMAAYERGTQNYNLALYEAALADFTEAASLYASPDFQFNIGLCFEKLGRYEDAIRAFATYLRAKPDAEDRAAVEERIHALEDENNRRKREAEEDRARTREAQRTPAEPPPAEPEVDEPPPTDSGRALILSGAALAGVGVAVGLGGGIALGVLARQRSTAVEAVQSEGNPEGLTFPQTQALEREGKRFEAIQIGLAAGGAVVAVTGAVLLAVGLRRRQADRTQAWLVGPLYTRTSSTTGLVLTGRF